MSETNINEWKRIDTLRMIVGFAAPVVMAIAAFFYFFKSIQWVLYPIFASILAQLYFAFWLWTGGRDGE